MKPIARKIFCAAIILAVGFCLGMFVIVACQKPQFSKDWFPLISTQSAGGFSSHNFSSFKFR
ncbi:MAG TPA: hypothetical protein VMD27_05335 [Candidatus Aquilonibacter sp.]|nr:hypothetical protein [Candidatus Aquilonibacter sp.]